MGTGVGAATGDATGGGATGTVVVELPTPWLGSLEEKKNDVSQTWT